MTMVRINVSRGIIEVEWDSVQELKRHLWDTSAGRMVTEELERSGTQHIVNLTQTERQQAMLDAIYAMDIERKGLTPDVHELRHHLNTALGIGLNE